jgi:hypothetical protein
MTFRFGKRYQVASMQGEVSFRAVTEGAPLLASSVLALYTVTLELEVDALLPSGHVVAQATLDSFFAGLPSATVSQTPEQLAGQLLTSVTAALAGQTRIRIVAVRISGGDLYAEARP